MSTTPPEAGAPGPSGGYGPGSSGGYGAGPYDRPPRAPWRFVRRERGRMIGGVASGMADAFRIDVTVMRVIWVIAAIVSAGIGVAAYAICWIAFPSDEAPAPMHELRRHDRGAGFVVGIVLLGIGLAIVFSEIVQPFRRGGNVVFATILIGAGAAVLLLRHPDAELAPFPPSVAPPPPAPSPPFPPGAAAWEAPAAAVDVDDQPGRAAPGAPATTTSTGPATSGAPSTSTAWSQHAPWPAPPTRPPWEHPSWSANEPWPRRRHRRSFLTPLTVSLLLIAAGIVVLLDNAGNASITLADALAGGVVLVGLALVVSAWFGRARGLIPIGLMLLLVAIPATAIDVPITGGMGATRYRPVSRSAIRSKYELGIGHLEVDLRAVSLANHTTHVYARLGIGQIVIDVPSSVRVVVKGHAGAGAVQLFGSDAGGGFPENATRIAPGTQPGELDIDARVGAGDIQVRRFEPGGVETFLGGPNQ